MRDLKACSGFDILISATKSLVAPRPESNSSKPSATPSTPILSNLSNTVSTAAWESTGKEYAFIRPRSAPREFKRIVKSSNPSSSRASLSVRRTSISDSGAAPPIMSTSHWQNSRNRPRPGRSARQTGPIWYRFTMRGSSFLRCEKSLIVGTVRS